MYTDRMKNKKNERRIAMEVPVEKKENKTWAIVGTVAAILLCGCPGLTLCVFGIWAATGTMTDFNYGYTPSWIGFAMLCVAIIFVAIAVVVPILLLRKKKPAAPSVEVLPPQEPLPPAS
jgi:uncharacterized membrane protein